jgi:hypothetical protein
MPFSFFGINGLGLSFDLLALSLVALWIALIAWTYFDAKRRIEDPLVILCATAASLYPYVGTLVYAILRPPDPLREAHERELERRVSTLRLRQLEEEVCLSCKHPIQRTYQRCPNCRTRVKNPCRSCGKPVDPRWSLCPYCETPVEPVAAARRPFSSPRPRTMSLPRSVRTSRRQVRYGARSRHTHGPAGQPVLDQNGAPDRPVLIESPSGGSRHSRP